MLHLAHTFWAAKENEDAIVGGIRVDKIAAAAAGCRAIPERSFEKWCMAGDVGGVVIWKGGYPSF